MTPHATHPCGHAAWVSVGAEAEAGCAEPRCEPGGSLVFHTFTESGVRSVRMERGWLGLWEDTGQPFRAFKRRALPMWLSPRSAAASPSRG